MDVRPAADERALIAALRRGDEAAFMQLVRELSPTMLRVARMFVSTQAIAEEVVQEAWVGVLNGIGGFEGRSSLKTWVLRILTNTAKTRGQREARTLPFSSLGGEDEPAVDADRFLGEDSRYPGHWAAPPSRWETQPEPRLLGGEALDVIQHAISRLPAAQAAVITLRDVDGLDAEEVCNALEISETNQRVLLHRARSKVRQALEEYMR